MDEKLPQASRLFTLDQVAARLGMSAQTVWRWVARGRLPAVRLGARSVRIRQEDLDEFVRERTDAQGRTHNASATGNGADGAGREGGKP